MKALRILMVCVIFCTTAIVSIGCSGYKDNDEVTIWAWNLNVRIMEDAVEKYKESVDSNFKAKVESFSQNDIDTKIKAAAQLQDASQMGDIVLGDAMKMRGYYDVWPQLFAILDDNGIKHSDKLKFNTASVELVSNTNDKLFAMPYGIAPTVVYAYKPLWIAAGLNPNDILTNGWTWEDYKSIGISINNATGGVMSEYNLRTDDRLYRTMVSQKGQWFMDKELNVQVGNNTSIDAMTMVKDFKESGILGHTTGDFKVNMKAGKVAAQVHGYFVSGQIKTAAPETSGDWVMLPLPRWQGDSSSSSITGGSFWYANNKSSRKSDALDFLKWFSLNTTNALQALKIGGIFPALTETYTDTYFDSADAFFGNQKQLKLTSGTVSTAPPIYPSKYNSFNYDTYISAQEDILFNHDNINTRLLTAKTSMENKKLNK